jgi:hypothetical protein
MNISRKFVDFVPPNQNFNIRVWFVSRSIRKYTESKIFQIHFESDHELVRHDWIWRQRVLIIVLGRTVSAVYCLLPPISHLSALKNALMVKAASQIFGIAWFAADRDRVLLVSSNLGDAILQTKFATASP